METRLRIASLNTRTLREDTKMVEFEYALNGIKWDIIGLSEVRRNQTDFVETKDGHVFCHSAADKSNLGVGFIINKKWTDNIKEFVPISPRLALLKLTINGHQLLLLQLHAPTSEYEDSVTEDFYDSIRNQLSTHEEKQTETYLIGDYNASIGQKIAGEDNIRGNSNFGTRNNKGSLLMNFAASTQMKILNSYFGKSEEEKWTWRSPKDDKYEIDYILCRKLENIERFYVQANFQFDSDHRMVMAEIILKKKRRQYNNLLKNLNHMKIKNSHKLYKEKLEKQLDNIETEKIHVQEYYGQILSCIREAVKWENQFSQQKKIIIKSKKLSEETINLIKKREELNRIVNKTEDQKKGHREIRKVVRREIRKDVNKYEEEKISQIIEDTGSTKKLYRNLAMNRRSYIHTIAHNNKIIRDREDIVETFACYFEEIYKSNQPKSNGTTRESHTERDEGCEKLEISMDEMDKAIKHLKNDKTPGEDGLTNELIKAGGINLCQHICTLFNQILEENIIPLEWETGNIILLHKKGPKELMENYRPISILPNLYKLFTKILQQKIEKQINNDQTHEQAGFRPSYSTTDHLHAINLLLEKCQEFGINLYLGFVDYSKAFDSLETKHIWPSLERAGIHPKIIDIFKTIYGRSKAKITLDKVSRPFNIERGVRQGCPSSPNLFNCVLQTIFLDLKWKNFGINIEGININNLRFADDIVIISKSLEELKIMLEQLAVKSEERGLHMNTSKTKFMSSEDHTSLEINNNKIEQVISYVYLGQLITMEDRSEQELERRRALAWKKFWGLKRILKARVSLKIKTKILQMCVFPTLIYGCQTWALKKELLSKLKATQTTMYRSILGIKKKDKVRNSKLHERIKLHPIEKTIKKLKLKWAGHVARMEEGRWAVQMTKWKPQGRKRKRGRQKVRWEDEIQQDCGTRWQSMAQNRDLWKGKTNQITDKESS